MSKLFVDCRRCSGTGSLPGGTIRLSKKCRACHGTGSIAIFCRICRATPGPLKMERDHRSPSGHRMRCKPCAAQYHRMRRRGARGRQAPIAQQVEMGGTP